MSSEGNFLCQDLEQYDILHMSFCVGFGLKED